MQGGLSWHHVHNAVRIKAAAAGVTLLHACEESGDAGQQIERTRFFDFGNDDVDSLVARFEYLLSLYTPDAVKEKVVDFFVLFCCKTLRITTLENLCSLLIICDRNTQTHINYHKET